MRFLTYQEQALAATTLIFFQKFVPSKILSLNSLELITVLALRISDRYKNPNQNSSTTEAKT